MRGIKFSRKLKDKAKRHLRIVAEVVWLDGVGWEAERRQRMGYEREMVAAVGACR